MSNAFDWASRSGDAWAERWRDTDRGLAPVGAALQAAVLDLAPAGAFDALDIGCGAGASSIALAAARPDANILGIDLSPALVAVARERAAGIESVSFQSGDAVEGAAENGPFDLFLSRHGVMFFPDPLVAFSSLRAAANDGAAFVFSCFRSWAENPWASELASAAAGRALPPPGREPSGFAFADPGYVSALLEGAGWTALEPEALAFTYTAGEGDTAADQAASFLTQIGPASAVLRDMPDAERPSALARMREVIKRYVDGRSVSFPAAAWIWRARARA